VVLFREIALNVGRYEQDGRKMKYSLDNKLKNITLIPESKKDSFYIGKALERHKIPHQLSFTNGELEKATMGIMNLWSYLAYDKPS